MTVGQDIYQPREPRPVTSDIESVRRFFEKLTAKGAFVAVSSSQQATTRPGGPLREMRSDQSLGEFSGFIEADGDLEPIERSFVANAVHSRRKEFALGRALARRALAAAGHARVGIPAGPDRAPIWPTGIIGSITHCDHIAVAAVAPTQSGIQAIGIDLERTAGTADLIDVVTTVRERMRQGIFMV